MSLSVSRGVLLKQVVRIVGVEDAAESVIRCNNLSSIILVDYLPRYNRENQDSSKELDLP